MGAGSGLSKTVDVVVVVVAEGAGAGRIADLDPGLALAGGILAHGPGKLSHMIYRDGLGQLFSRVS